MDVTVRVRRSSHTSGGSPFVIFTDSPTNFFSAGLPTCLGELRLVYSKGEKASPRPINSEFYMGRIFVGTSIQALPSVFLFVLLVFLSFSFFFSLVLIFVRRQIERNTARPRVYLPPLRGIPRNKQTSYTKNT